MSDTSTKQLKQCSSVDMTPTNVGVFDRVQRAHSWLRFVRPIAIAPIVAIGALSCGNTNTGAMDAGRDVMGDVVEYGVRGRPRNNSYCARLEASPTPVATDASFIALCKPNAPAGTQCPNGLDRCLPIERFSPDLAEYARNNRVPQICPFTIAGLEIPRCDDPQRMGCSDGTFCAYARHDITHEVWPMCVPYPCNP